MRWLEPYSIGGGVTKGSENPTGEWRQVWRVQRRASNIALSSYGLSFDSCIRPGFKNSMELSRGQIEDLGFPQDHFRSFSGLLRPTVQRYLAREHGREDDESETECFFSDH